MLKCKGRFLGNTGEESLGNEHRLFAVFASNELR
jgi:hypothetical protein